MRVILCCAGRVPDPKWNNYLGVPKHLAPVGGRPLLQRTVEQMQRFTRDIVIAAPAGDDRYNIPGATLVHPRADAADEYHGSRPWWNSDGRTVLMLGDVYFSDAAAQTIGGYRAQAPRWFGRFGAARLTASRWGEIFAVSWWPQHHETLDHHMALVVGSPHITRPPGWKLYRAYHGRPMRPHVKAGHWTEINDLTDDFDVPSTYNAHPAVTGRPYKASGLHKPKA